VAARMVYTAGSGWDMFISLCPPVGLVRMPNRAFMLPSRDARRHAGTWLQLLMPARSMTVTTVRDTTPRFQAHWVQLSTHLCTQLLLTSRGVWGITEARPWPCDILRAMI
jgi:hypothetical protein